MEKLGDRIAQLRTLHGLSQSEVARRMGTSQSAVSQIEAGERNPSFETLRSLADALSVSVSRLVGAEGADLTVEEQQHFRELRSLTPESQAELRNFAAFLVSRSSQKSK